MGNTRDMRFYNDGLGRALDIVKVLGIDGLEQEIKRRGAYAIPGNIPSYLLKSAAREHAKVELRIVATAMADTMANDMSLPPSTIVKYLKLFNDKCDAYRDDPDECVKAQTQLDSLYALNKTIEKFNLEGKE